MICTQATAPGPSTPRTPRTLTTFAPTCGSAYTYTSSSDISSSAAIYPFPGPAPAMHQRELYLRALEQEREEILAEAYAAKRSGSPLSHEEYLHKYTDDSEDEDDSQPRFDDRGRQLSFRETVRQRQARLEFLRRQDFARRLAHRGLAGDSRASLYAIRRLPPPRARPIERVNAARTIQRAWRVYSAVKALKGVEEGVKEAREAFLRLSKTDYEGAWKGHAERMHVLLRELGERAGVLSSPSAQATESESSKVALHPRVRTAARKAMDALRSELALLDRAQVSRYRSSSPTSQFLSGSFSDSDSDSESEGYDEEYDEEYDSEEDDSEAEDDDDDEYASYTYTPPQLVKTELYVVDEEDEDEGEDELTSDFASESSNAMHLYQSPKTKTTSNTHTRTRHAPLSHSFSFSAPVLVPVNVPALIRSPVSRSPSLASIPEDEEEAFFV